MQTVINHPGFLTDYAIVEDNLIQDLPQFKTFQNKITPIYQQLVRFHPELEYRQYQIDDAAILCCRRNHLITHALGLGKTTLTLLAMLGIYWPTCTRRVGSIHIVVPNILSAQRWIEELDRLNRLPSISTYYQVVRSEKELLQATAPVLIYTHDFPKCRAKSLQGSRAFISRLLGKRYQPRMLIIDEAHNCQSSSLRSKHLEYLCRKAKRRVALTGTLTELPHVYQACQLVYGDYFPFDNLASFTKRFSQKHKLHTNYAGKSGEDAPERWLQRLDMSKAPAYYDLMRRYVYRVRVDDPHVLSCVTRPEPITQLHKVQPTEDQMDIHDAYLKAYQHQLRLATTNQRNKAATLRLINPLIQVANCPAESSNKLVKVAEIVNKAEGKVIIFCHYVLSARVITDYLRSLLDPNSIVRLYSKDSLENPPELTQQHRVDLVSRFQYDPNIKVGVFSINLAAESIDLTAATDVIYYCSGWSSIKVQQSISRAVRPGNRNKTVNIHYPYTEGLIDAHQIMLTVEKLAGSRLLMDYDTGDNLSEDLSPAEAIRKLLGS